MPELEHGSHLIGYLQELGFAMNVGMGPVPLSQQELRYWQQNTGLALSAWEVLTLRKLSQAYVGQMAVSKDLNAIAPYRGAVKIEQRQAVDSFFGNLAGG